MCYCDNHVHPRCCLVVSLALRASLFIFIIIFYNLVTYIL